MTFFAFRSGVKRLLQRSGDTSKVWFEADEDKGLFEARTASGTRIMMPMSGKSITVRWASGHQAMASADILSA